MSSENLLSQNQLKRLRILPIYPILEAVGDLKSSSLFFGRENKLCIRANYTH